MSDEAVDRFEYRLYWPEDGESSSFTDSLTAIRELHATCEAVADKAGSVIQRRRIVKTGWENI